MKRILLALAFVLLSALPSQAALGYYAPITYDHTQVGSSDSSNFPIFFGGNAALKTVANGGSYVQLSNAHDIQFFSDSSCSTLLDYEFVTWDATTGLGEWWIRIATLSHSADGTIYVCVGDAGASDRSNKTGVWDANYKAVYHLGDGSTLGLSDSTSNGNTLNNRNSATATAGQIGGAVATDGSASYLDTASLTTPYNTMTNFTVEAWIYTDTSSGLRGAVNNGDIAGDDGYYITQDGGGGLRFHTHAGFGGNQSISTNTWTHNVVTVDGSNNGISYKNGDSTNGTSTPSIITPSSAQTGFTIGALNGNSTFNTHQNYWSGKVDEVRLSSVVRSADWVTAQYNNQKASSTLLSLGSFTATGGGGGGSTPETLPLLGVGPGQ